MSLTVRREAAASVGAKLSTRVADFANAAAFAGALVTIAVLLTVSGVSLDALGYHYDSEGGSALQKVHPATLMMVAIIGLRALARPSPRDVHDLLLGEAGLVVAAASVLVAIAYIATVLKVPVTPPIDTYLMPVLACLMLKGMSRHGLHVIACGVLAIFVFNDLVAFYEYATGSRVFFVIPPEVTGHPEAVGSEIFDWKGHLAWDWRSSAMFGHPLDNALVTGTLVMILQSRRADWLPAWLRAGIGLVSLAAMVTFGGRVALGLVIAMSAALWGARAIRAVLAGRRLAPRGLAAACALVPVAIGGAALAFESGFLDKFLDRFVSDDGSAETRVLMWRLFEPLSPFDLVAGPDQDVVKLWQRLQGLELGIESFWAGMPLGYGLAVTAIVLTGWVGLFAYLAKATGRASWWPVLYFMIVASTSAGLASKSLALGTMSCACWCVSHQTGAGVAHPSRSRCSHATASRGHTRGWRRNEQKPVCRSPPA